MDIELLLTKFPRIGIWGMPGIGKTTIARKLFVKNFAQYDNTCFLENVREQSEKFGLASIRNRLFGELLKRQITTFDILSKLGSKKVFIVLDDVDEAAKLEYLCKDLRYLGPNSRLIVTTRDRHMLMTRVDEIYHVKEWKYAESLKLFSLGAFEQDHPKEGYGYLSERVVAYAGGVPLALEILGLHFRSRNIQFWKSELSYFESKQESFKEIREVLEVSYNGLREREKAIFLDVAFFFKDENKDFVLRILNACGSDATSGIEILQDKALITISKSNKIQMHDLLHEMGLDIVRKCFRTDPGRRSRLEHMDEVRHVLENNKGTDTVEGMTLDLSQKIDLHLQIDSFIMMTKLRFLRLYVPLGKKRLANVYNPGFLNGCSDELRYLEWYGYPLKSLPPKFCAKFLVEIRMPHSHIEELWQGTQDLINLETIDLSECKQLMELPDLCKALKLKWVYLSGCESLRIVHPSLLYADTLETLILQGCKNLKILRSEKHLKYLQELNVEYCTGLKEFSVSSHSITRLDLSKTGIQKLDSSIGRLRKLVQLNLGSLRLQHLPDELSHLKHLQELRISNCGLVNKRKLHFLCDSLFSLKLLHLKNCYMLFELPNNISSLSSLYELRLDGSSLKKLPTSIKLLEKLEILSLDDCWKLRSLPELPLLINKLYAMGCTSLVTISTLCTFSVLMKGKVKRISFQNGMKLNRHSILHIKEEAQFIMKSAALHNVFVRMFTVDKQRYNFNGVGVCLPGSHVPEHFVYRTTESSITIELPGRDNCSNLIGFIYSVVLSSLKLSDVLIQCFQDGLEVGHAITSHYGPFSGFDSYHDHVFLWYDPFHCNLILSRQGQNKLLKLCVTAYSWDLEDPNLIREFGVHPIYISDSELHNFLHEAATLKLELKLELGLKFQLAVDLLRGYDQAVGAKFCLAWENGYELDDSLKSNFESRRQAIFRLVEKERRGIRSQIQNQDQNLSDSLLDSANKSNGRKDRYFGDIKSTHKETSTCAEIGHRQIFMTESTDLVDYICGLFHLPPIRGLRPDELWYFILSGYPFKSLPSAICATVLVEIRMPHNNVKELWQGIQELHNLKIFELAECKQLVRLPDLFKASRLEWLNLHGCKSLCHLHPFHIKCQCRMKECTRATWVSTDIKEMNSDPFHCAGILKFHEPTVCSNFCVANDTMEVDGSTYIKDSGISDLKLQSVSAELDLDSEEKKNWKKEEELDSGRSTTLTSIETPEEEESSGMRNHIKNQQWDSTEQSSNDIIDESSLEIEMVKPYSNEECNGWVDHYSNIKEGIKSNSKETKTGAENGSSRHIIITKSTNMDFKPIVEEDVQDMPTASSLVEDASIMPNFPLPESIIDLDYINKLIDEDPIGAIESFLSGKISVSSKTQQSTTHNDVPKVDSAPWTKLINNLRDLAFDSNLFRLLHNDILLIEIKDLLKQIEKYLDEMPEDLVFEVKKFNDFYTGVLKNMRESNECVEEQKKIGASHQMVLKQMKESKAEFEEVTTLIDQSNVKLTSINDQVVELERKLAETKREQSLLQSTMDKCVRQKEDVITKCASLSHEMKNVMVRMQKAEAAQQTFDEVNQKQCNIYSKMRANPPF